jgi:tetratricopeptide (TPR) repeat protein
MNKKRLVLLVSITVAIILVVWVGLFLSPQSTNNPNRLIDLGEKYLLELDYEKALVQFLRVIEIEPMNPRGYTGAAEAYVGLERFDEAIAILQQGIEYTGSDDIIEMLDWVINSVLYEVVPVRLDLTEAKRQELNEYFSKFVYTAFPLGDYDIEDMANSNDVLLKFTIFYANSDGMRSYYSSTDPVNTMDFGIEDIYSGRSYISERRVNEFLSTFFGVDTILHRTIQYSDFGYYFEYANDRYYIPLGDGTHWQEPNVIEFYDNGNGTFSARIEIADYGVGSGFGENPVPIAHYYNNAVIRPYNDNGKNTYQLLYWKNNVNINEPFPVRQPANQTEQTVADFEYVIDGNSVTITRYTGNASDVIIPSEIEGLPVTTIGAWAFAENWSLTNVTIPDSITKIEVGAFYACDYLSAPSIQRIMEIDSGAAFQRNFN